MRFFYQLILLILIFCGALLGAYICKFFFQDDPFPLMVGAFVCAMPFFIFKNKIFSLLDRIFKNSENTNG